jgi:hypothetical protein
MIPRAKNNEKLRSLYVTLLDAVEKRLTELVAASIE